MSYGGDDFDMDIGLIGLAFVVFFPFVVIFLVVFKLAELITKMFNK